MTPDLDQLLRILEPATAENLDARLRFGLMCVKRVSALMEQTEALDSLDEFAQIIEAAESRNALAALAASTDALANRHQGSRSLDGVGHAAVSATYALAKACAGKARQASEYAAYAAVYGQGGYGATSDPSSFVPEYEWQADQLRSVLASSRLAPSAA
jgi:hypothetical protein